MAARRAPGVRYRLAGGRASRQLLPLSPALLGQRLQRGAFSGVSSRLGRQLCFVRESRKAADGLVVSFLHGVAVDALDELHGLLATPTPKAQGGGHPRT